MGGECKWGVGVIKTPAHTLKRIRTCEAAVWSRRPIWHLARRWQEPQPCKLAQPSHNPISHASAPSNAAQCNVAQLNEATQRPQINAELSKSTHFSKSRRGAEAPRTAAPRRRRGMPRGCVGLHEAHEAPCGAFPPSVSPRTGTRLEEP